MPSVSVMRCFNWAAERNYLPENPVRKVPDKPKRKRREVVFSPELWEDLRSRIKDQAFGDFVDFMNETGCRPKEARIMEARHVRLEHDVVIFPPSESKGGERGRTIFLTDKAAEICRRNMRPEGPILLNTQGRPWTKNSINSRFQRLKKKLGKQVFAYAIRHTFITDSLLAGQDSTVLGELVGHADKKMVSTVYAHLDQHPEFLKAQMKKRRAG